MSRVSLTGLWLCNQRIDGLGRPAETTHSSRTFCPVRAITLLLKPGLKAGISVGSSAEFFKSNQISFSFHFLKMNFYTFDDESGGRVGVAGLVDCPAFKDGAIFDKDLREAQLAQAVVVGDDVIARVIDADAVLVPRNQRGRHAHHPATQLMRLAFPGRRIHQRLHELRG